MNKKGFTLIELLAVIVILAIIMVIAVPQILNVINKTRENAHKNSIELLKYGIQTQIAASELTNTNPFTKGEDGCYTFDFDNKNANYEALNVKNKEIFTGTIKYCNGSFEGEPGIDGESTPTTAYKCKKIGSGSLAVGTPFACDVNGDGTYDQTNEKFYYVSDYYNTKSKSFDSSYATLVYSYNTIGGVKDTQYNTVYGTTGPSTLRDNLPTTTQWSNITLKSTSRDILDEDGGVRVSDFDYSGKAARILTYQEVVKACNNCNLTTSNSLSGLGFLFDNMTQAGPYPGYWLETLSIGYNGGAAWLLYGAEKRASVTYLYLDYHAPRPAIDVKKTDMQY